MGRSNCQKFIKSYDRYEKTVSLSYKKKGNFATPIGGICSIISFTFLAYWLAVNIWDTFAPPGTFNTNKSVSLLQEVNGEYPEFYVPFERFFMTYSLESLEVPAEDSIDDYMVGIWFQ